jgi:hypothetical protein
VLESIAAGVRVSDRYGTRTDRLNGMRIWWCAATARQTLHLLPRETILELACGSGTLTHALDLRSTPHRLA